MTSVRVLTYNILGGKARVALRSVVRAVNPDVMVVNESPQTPLLWRWQCPSLARQWDLQHVAGGRNAGRNMIFAQHHIGVAETHVKRFQQPLLRPIRGVVSAQLQADSHRFGVVGVHLALDPDAREGQVQQVLRAADRLRGPVVVAGDFNEPPKGPSWEALRAAGFVDHGDADDFTYPAEHPVKRVDALLVRGDVRVSRHRIPGIQPELLRLASDHLPVVATLAWP
ncbi:MAG: endonuclease/exonuclease/phosphatase family protein [Actinomycetota bacterium]|nr:endonuclease/exonuclease/phosphatase family protein [Actinomycetota bacterium]